jgi:O-antigen/teichoic acid export membrane protein
MRDRSFFRHALLYGLSSVLVQAGGVVLVPLYARCLSKADFGALEVLGRCAEMAGTLLLISGLRQGLTAFYQQSKTDQEREGVFRATMLLLLALSLAGGTLMMSLAGPVCDFFRPDPAAISAGLMRLAFLAVLLEPLSLMPMALLQARVESTTFVAVTASQFVVRVALCVALTAWLPWGVTGVLTATALTAAVYGVALSLRELLRGGAWPQREQLAGLFRFALPFLPAGLCAFLLQNGDRFFLLYWHGEEEVGVYGLGYKVALAVSTFSVAPLQMVWSARMFEASEAPDAPQVFGRAFTRILAAFLLVGLGVCLFEDEAALLLGGRAYAGAARVIAPVVLAGFFLSAAMLMDAGFYVRRRTGLKLGITASAAAVILVLYAALIPPYGAMGAALATLGAFAFLAFCTWRTVRRIFPVDYEWGRVSALVALAAGLWLASRPLPPAGWAIAAKAGLWLLWPLLVWVLGLASPQEKAHVRDAVRQALAWLRGGGKQEEAPPAEAAWVTEEDIVECVSGRCEAGAFVSLQAGDTPHETHFCPVKRME